MTAKEFIKKPGVILFLGVLIGGALIWISKGLSSGSWNIFATTPSAGELAVTEATREASVDTNPTLRISVLPKGHLNTMSNSEKRIIARLFSQTNANGNSQTFIDQANGELQDIGSALSIENNTPDPRNPSAFAKPCQEGKSGWTLIFTSFTIRNCK